MKARLKESQVETHLSDMKEQQFAVILDGKLEGHIVYRLCSDMGNFAINLTSGCYWDTCPEITNPPVRILQAGEVIEITD